MKEIICKCGNKMWKDYGKCTSIAEHVKETVKGKEITSIKIVRSWMCNKCGQDFYEEANKPIKI